jgi:plasmid maintenance system antidote protein VapI
MSLLEQLRQHIRGCGLTTHSLARHLKISPSQLQNFISGKSGIYLSTACVIAEALGLELCQVKQSSIPPQRKAGRPRTRV